MKAALRTDDDTVAWQAWNVAHDLIWQSCRPGPPLVFPGEKELIRAMYDQIGKEEQIISPLLDFKLPPLRCISGSPVVQLHFHSRSRIEESFQGHCKPELR